MQVAIYARVSTEEQARKENSIPTQVEQCTQYVLSQPDWTIFKVYTDPGYTAAHLFRPDMRKMLSDIDNGDINIVLVSKLDRLSRDMKDVINLVKSWERGKCFFKSVSEPFDTNTPIGKQMLYMLASFAEFERERIGERTSEGLQKKAQRGEWPSGIAPFGYTKNSNSILKIIEEEALTVQKIYDMYLSGYGYLSIARYLNELGVISPSGEQWHSNTVKQILRNKVYIGVIEFGKTITGYVDGKKRNIGERDKFIIAAGKHEPIIDTETFSKVQFLLEKNKTNRKWKRTKNTTHLLTGILKCECGGMMYAQNTNLKKKTYQYYVCANKMAGKILCKRQAVYKDIIDKQVYTFFQKNITPMFIDKIKVSDSSNKDPKKAKLKILNKQLEKQKKIHDNLFSALGRGVISDEDFIKQRDTIRKTTIKIEKELQSLQLPQPSKTRHNLMIQLKNKIKTPYEDIKPDDFPIIRQIISQIVKEIILVSNDEVKIIL